jgi:hypothetical protein
MELNSVSMKRAIECPHFGAPNTIDLVDYSTDDCTTERQMGPETQYWFDCDDAECVIYRSCFPGYRLHNRVPFGAYGSEHAEIIKENSFGGG